MKLYLQFQFVVLGMLKTSSLAYSGAVSIIAKTVAITAKTGVITEKNDGKTAKNGVIRRHQASHDFWGRQNCHPPRTPITNGTLRRCQSKNWPDTINSTAKQSR